MTPYSTFSLCSSLIGPLHTKLLFFFINKMHQIIGHQCQDIMSPHVPVSNMAYFYNFAEPPLEVRGEVWGREIEKSNNCNNLLSYDVNFQIFGLLSI